MIGTNIYTVQFVSRCPNDGARIVYTATIETPRTIQVEEINAHVAELREGFHERIADRMHEKFGGEQRIFATHQGVDIETVRLCD